MSRDVNHAHNAADVEDRLLLRGIHERNRISTYHQPRRNGRVAGPEGDRRMGGCVLLEVHVRAIE